ncbi:MAG: bifunctional riboflavin kinase/FAD synthetase [Actinobacteria bacterium]|nr:bifunctional riboflavin kinase/FAD synthetase [Actinomycetota bacterium]
MQKQVVAIGVFDGVHRGHQQILARARELANLHSLPVLALTFHPHPTAILAPDKQPLLLSNIHSRIELLQKHGADDVEVITFSKDFAALSPSAFIEEILIEQLRASHVVVGEGFSFGSKASGSIQDIRHYLQADAVPLLADENGVISSTRIRGHVARGEMEAAHALLGRAHFLQGEVIHGEKRGRKIGYPTANLEQLVGMAIPLDGIYAGYLYVEQQRLPAAISIGTNPTFPPSYPGERPRQVEAYALDRDDLDIYGQRASIEFISFLRPTIAFPGLEPLLAQMAEDCQRAKGILAGR